MAKHKVCRNCKLIVEETVESCPNCSSTGQWNENYQGRIYVVDPVKSVLGAKIGAKIKGEYAVRSRS